MNRERVAVAQLDLVDETFIVASRQQVRAALCEAARWMSWFPGTCFAAHEDRGLRGVRWTLSGELAGTAEVWLEEWADGTIVHAYVRAESRRLTGSRYAVAKAVRRHYQLSLKARMFVVKAELEGGRAAGIPRIPSAQRVVVSPRTNSPTDEN